MEDSALLFIPILKVTNVPNASQIFQASGAFIGFAFSLTLLGITILQAWNYAQSNHDGWKLWTFVTLLVIMDVSATSASSIFIYNLYVVNGGDFLLMSTINNAYFVEFGLTSVIIFLVQLFFASRVHFLNPGKYWLAGSITFIAILAFAATVYTIAGQTWDRGFANVSLPPIWVSSAIHQALTIVVDGFITIILSANFIKARSELHGRWTRRRLQSLLVFSVARGLLITLSDTAFLILWIINPMNMDWMPIRLSLAKIYVISMLALLNGRPSSTSRNRPEREELTPIQFIASTRTSNLSRAGQDYSVNIDETTGAEGVQSKFLS